MDKQQLEREIHRLAPFKYDVELPYGLRTCPPGLVQRYGQRTRLQTLMKHAFPPLLEACNSSLKGLRVLDVACNCGGFSVEASNLEAEYVLGIDIVDRYIEQAQFIKTALSLKNVDFQTLDIENVSEGTVGEFDVLFCFGILYHMENPVGAMRKLSAVTRRIMMVDTNLMPTWLDKRPLWRMNVVAQAPSLLDRKSATNLWRDRDYCQFEPTASAVIDLLKFLDFQQVQKLEPRIKGLRKRYYTGRRATFLAIRER